MVVNIKESVSKKKKNQFSNEKIVVETKNLNFYYTSESPALKNVNIMLM